jgi:hypothetical protein
MTTLRGALALLVVATPGLAATVFSVDPAAGRNQFVAIFDAPAGERIAAVSARVGCTITVDAAGRAGTAVCTVPLTAIRVDNDETKSEHFRQWATNNASDPAACRLVLTVPRLELPGPIVPGKTVSVATRGTFAICGRPRDDRGSEAIALKLTYQPPADGEPHLLRIRAHVDGFDRERYRVSPRHTSGWLARVQRLADVVASTGTIDVSLFATAPAADVAP